jgi:NADH-quinone oxidoreductase subunit M
VNMGSFPERWREHRLGDIFAIEWLSWTPLLALILALGLFPRVIFGISQEAVTAITAILDVGARG